MTRYALGLGSNVGDRQQHLRYAVEMIAGRLGEPVVSPLYKSAPVGGPEQGPFLNAVVVVETDLDDHAVLAVCQEIEYTAGRERKERWGPRTLDIDVIASDGPGLSDERLTVPHPRAAEREFVLRPLTDVWAEASVAEGLTATRALTLVGDQGVRLVANDWVV